MKVFAIFSVLSGAGGGMSLRMQHAGGIPASFNAVYLNDIVMKLEAYGYDLAWRYIGVSPTLPVR